MNQIALEGVNILGVIATALFIIPTSFLIIILFYVKSASEGNVSGGFSQYESSAVDKKTNEAAVLKGKGPRHAPRIVPA